MTTVATMDPLDGTQVFSQFGKLGPNVFGRFMHTRKGSYQSERRRYDVNVKVNLNDDDFHPSLSVVPSPIHATCIHAKVI